MRMSRHLGMSSKRNTKDMIIQWAIKTAIVNINSANARFPYEQNTRNEYWRTIINVNLLDLSSLTGTYHSDCASFASAVCTKATRYNYLRDGTALPYGPDGIEGNGYYTGNLGPGLIAHGFSQISSAAQSSELSPGDILVDNDAHAGVWIGPYVYNGKTYNVVESGGIATTGSGGTGDGIGFSNYSDSRLAAFSAFRFTKR